MTQVAAFRERVARPIAATIALEMIGPIPGTLVKRSQPTSRRARSSISLDRPSMTHKSHRTVIADAPRAQAAQKELGMSRRQLHVNVGGVKYFVRQVVEMARPDSAGLMCSSIHLH